MTLSLFRSMDSRSATSPFEPPTWLCVLIALGVAFCLTDFAPESGMATPHRVARTSPVR